MCRRGSSRSGRRWSLRRARRRGQSLRRRLVPCGSFGRDEAGGLGGRRLGERCRAGAGRRRLGERGRRAGAGRAALQGAVHGLAGVRRAAGAGLRSAFARRAGPFDRGSEPARAARAGRGAREEEVLGDGHAAPARGRRRPRPARQPQRCGPAPARRRQRCGPAPARCGQRCPFAAAWLRQPAPARHSCGGPPRCARARWRALHVRRQKRTALSRDGAARAASRSAVRARGARDGRKSPPALPRAQCAGGGARLRARVHAGAEAPPDG